MEEYKHWKWSNGSKLIKTIKSVDNHIKNSNQENIESVTEKKELPEKSEANKFVEFEQIKIEPSNKRTETSERMSSRHMIIQTAVNPFLKDSDYLHDINIQDTLLRPKDSNYKNNNLFN
tara:strand:- start:105 stop:461 length:357 start_codon:yes stop_codon:yes gene_type:complete